MVLGVSLTYFNQAWQDKYSAQVAKYMPTEIVVYDVSDRLYSADTDTWTETTITYIADVARVQPLRQANEAPVPGNSTRVQDVLVSVPITNNTVDLREGLQMRVLVAPLNPNLLKYAYVVSEVIDSGNPIEMTFLCRVDQEVVV